MLRKLTPALFAVALIFFAGSVSALPLGMTQNTWTNANWSGTSWDYLSHVDFHEQGGDSEGYWIGNNYWGYDQSSFSYSHNLPVDLTDGVTRAYLWINADYVDTYGNLVTLEGRYTGLLNRSEWSFSWESWTWTSESNTIYDLTPLPADIWSGGSLGLTINSNGWWESGIRVNSSTLALNYNPGDPMHAAVPEPLTFTLFGLGLLGLGIYRRMNKVS
ncbi:PEP-CTERM sorting domain-containing protein [candidate division GN15 bacterium]|nr:PEP-CTERM sorting domain-containing protein [candidate division GN15 bacterium]